MSESTVSRYKKNPDIVEAVEVDINKLSDLLQWTQARASMDFNEGVVYITLQFQNNTTATVKQGEYVVREAPESYRGYTREEFMESFAPLDEMDADDPNSDPELD